MNILKKAAASRTLISTLAAVALIAAGAVAIHHDLADGHTPDSVCEFCIAGAGLAGANVGETAGAALASVSLRIPDAVHRVQSNVPLRYRFARAPPAAS